LPTATRDLSSFTHGAMQLPAVTVESYNLEVRDEEGFVGDKASGRAFRELLDDLREKVGEDADPFGDAPSREIKKKNLDRVLIEGDPVAAGIVHGAIEEFSQNLAQVVKRFMRLKAWREVERVVVGGGLRQSRVGEVAIGRTTVLLKSEDIDVDLVPLSCHPDEAALIGCTRLVPAWLFEGFDAILAVDVGGSNIRCGAVSLNTEKASDFSRAEVDFFELWRYAEEKPTREEAVERMVEMLQRLIRKAKRQDTRLAPFIGVGCPGLIDDKGTIMRGAQNLPGNWESSRFNLPTLLREQVPTIGDHESVVVMHNDAVVQGLSELPAMKDVERWGVLTMGTGLGNASFGNKTS
jgi:predicted NBD/HSP70 family sugar kinase